MNIKIPFIGFIEKTVQMNIIKKLVAVFRDTQDIHRVLIVIPLTLFVSHSYYLTQQPHVSVIFYKLQRSEVIWVGLIGFIFVFVAFWAVLSSPFHPALYVRQGVFVIWTGLLHRLLYGLEILGTTYFTVVSFIALTSFLPFAFTGLKIDQLFARFKDEYKAKKAEKRPAIIIDSSGKERSGAA